VYLRQAIKEEFMRNRIVLVAVVTALAASASATAGGWATVGLDPLPTGVGPGDTWTTEMTVLQHGRAETPLVGLSPTITITEESGESRTFVATETAEPGVYEAQVVFPEAGQWSIVADSTFGDSKLTYGPVAIEPDSGGAPGSLPALPTLGIIGAIALAAVAAFGILRMRRLNPAS
jgi:hypothetical protein